jgi:large subunit ribosomal protein L25
MKTVEIKGTAREAVGKKNAKAVRAQELIPCVLYGGETPVHFQASEKDFRKIVYTPEVFAINLAVDGQNYTAIMQDLQFHPVSDKLLHVDFLMVRDNVPVKLEIPVRFEGYAKGMQQGGRLKTNLRTLKVKGLVKNIPDEIKIDVTNLNLGESIRVGDIKVEGVDILNVKSVPVASVVVTRAARAAMTETAKGK